MQKFVPVLGLFLIAAACSSTVGPLPCDTDLNCPIGQSCGAAGLCVDGTTDAGAGSDGGSAEDGGAADSGTPSDAGPQDAGADAGSMDAGIDAGSQDAGDDAGATDAGSDAGARDAGADAGSMDAGADAGPIDAGSVDAGIDAGPMDAGSVDAGIDAGPADAGFDAGTITASISITAPTPNQYEGIQSISVAAVGQAPGIFSSVIFELDQGGQEIALQQLTDGSTGSFNSTLTLTGTKVQGGPATVVATIYWNENGVPQHLDANPIAVFIDAAPPQFSGLSTDRLWYSGLAQPQQTAQIGVDINDVSSGTDPDSVVLSAGTGVNAAYYATSLNQGNGFYEFQIPVSNLSTSPSFVGPVSYSVAAADNVDNFAMISASLNVDNAPPVFAPLVYDAGWYPGNAGIVVPANVQDQDGGSGVDGGSVALLLGNGAALSASSISDAGTYTFATTGFAILDGGQGPVPFNLIAADIAGNVAFIDGGQLLVDEQAPVLGATTIVPSSNDGGWYARDAGIIAASQVVNDGAGSGAGSATLYAADGAGVTAIATGNCGGGTVCAVPVPATAQTPGSESPIALSASGADNVGNSTAIQPAGAMLLIDDKAPTLTATFESPLRYVDSNGVSWFQLLPLGNNEEVFLNVFAHDLGSGVDVGSWQASSGATRIDDQRSSFVSEGLLAIVVSGNAPLVPFGSQGIIPYSVFVSDAVGNTASIVGPGLGVDGEPPGVVFNSVPSGWYGGTSSISLTATVQDPNGSGVDAGTVHLATSTGVTLLPSGVNGSSYTFATTGSALLLPVRQGPVQFNVSATDNVGNMATVDGGQILVDELPPVLAGTEVTPSTNAGGWYARDAGSISVLEDVTDGTGSGLQSATLLAANGPSYNGLCDGGTCTFQVPATAQDAGSETPIALSISAVDNVGNSTGIQPTGATLLIDDKAPAITSAISANTPAKYVDASGVNWFKQSDSGEIEIDATITDLGSGVVPGSVKLMSGATRIDDPNAKTNSGSSYKLFIPRTGSAPLIPANSQGAISFTVVASDGVGNSTSIAGPSIGIDGAAPVITFSLAGQYPSAGTNCDPTVPSGVSSTIVCGHDGSRFTRTGDDGSTLSFSAADTGGSGNVTTSATCAIPGQASCTVSYSVIPRVSARYLFTINPSQVTFTSDGDGRGSVTVTVTLLDEVGNQATASGAVNITRLKWIRSLPTNYSDVSAPIVVTPVINSGGRLLLVGGTGTAAPVAALDTYGGFLTSGTVGTTGGGVVNLAYSASTQTLYTTQQGSTTMTAFTASSSGLASSYGCTPSSSASLNGPAAIIGSGANERAIVADSSTGKLFALSGSGSACNTAGISSTAVVSSSDLQHVVGDPATDGNNVYATFLDESSFTTCNTCIVSSDSENIRLPDVPIAGGSGGGGGGGSGGGSGSTTTYTYSSGIAKTSFAVATGFASPVSASLESSSHSGTGIFSFTGVIGAPAIAGASLFQGIVTSYGSLPTSFTGSSTNQWSGSGIGAMSDTIASTPVVYGGLVYGVAGSKDGSLRVFNSSSGAQVFTAATGVLNSQVALGGEATPVIYFTDSNGNLHAVVQSGTTVANAANWSTAFTGATTGATFTGVTNEPTLAADGTLYFGTQSAQVFAIATDSPGPAAPSTSSWPRAQFDNCNSSNTSLSCP